MCGGRAEPGGAPRQAPYAMRGAACEGACASPAAAVAAPVFGGGPAHCRARRQGTVTGRAAGDRTRRSAQMLGTSKCACMRACVFKQVDRCMLSRRAAARNCEERRGMTKEHGGRRPEAESLQQVHAFVDVSAGEGAAEAKAAPTTTYGGEGPLVPDLVTCCNSIQVPRIKEISGESDYDYDDHHSSHSEYSYHLSGIIYHVLANRCLLHIMYYV